MAITIPIVRRGSIHNYQSVVYYNGVLVGIIGSDSLTINATENVSYTNASITGDTPFTAHTSGAEITVEIPLLDYNKSVREEISDIVREVSGATIPTSIDNPFTGSIEGFINPSTKEEKPLVVYPIFVDRKGIFGSAGTQYVDDTANPQAYLFPYAVNEGDWNFDANSTEPQPYTLTFKVLPDVENGHRLFIQSAGIDTDGTFTLPV